MAAPARLGPTRWAWLVAGWLAVGIGAVGVIVPGLPTTVFFIVAASCFSRSSPRFERWVLDLPGVGRMVRDHRAGLGMPGRAKAAAVATMVAFAGGGLLLARPAPVVTAVVVALVAVGSAWITWRIPTREDVGDRAGTVREPPAPGAPAVPRPGVAGSRAAAGLLGPPGASAGGAAAWGWGRRGRKRR